MEDDGQIIDELNMIDKKSKVGRRLVRRKENFYMSMICFSRKNENLKQKRCIVTDRALYFLKKGVVSCQSGLTFAQKFRVADFKDITIDRKRLCLVLHMAKDDDLFLQIANLNLTELEGFDSSKQPENAREDTVRLTTGDVLNTQQVKEETQKVVSVRMQQK